MDLCDSLIFGCKELNREIGPHACQMLLRDFSKNAFPKHHIGSSPMSTGILGGGLVVDLGWLRFCDCFDHILVTPIRS